MRCKYLFVTLILVSLFAMSLVSVAFASGQFNGAMPYLLPPVGHYNTYVINNLSLGIYYDLMEEPLAMYKWADGTWVPILATSWKLIPPDKFEVKLRQGVKFNDGSEFTSKDVATTFNVGYLMNWVVWKYLDRIETPDKYTVVFHMKTPTSTIVRYVLRTQIRAHSVYGQYAEKAMKLKAAGKDQDSEEVKALRMEFEQFRPERMVGTGPYEIDRNSITEAQLTLKKVNTSWAASKVKFDKILLYNGETPVVTPLCLAKQVDYATHGFPPATEKAFISAGIRILRPPLYSGPALVFNNDIYPLNRKEVRQAIAYVINRDENAMVSLGNSARRQKYMTGFSDNLAPLWISKEDLGKLNEYPYDPAKAEKLLTSIGFKKGKDGVWVTDKGERMEFELRVPAEYADWAAAAENAAQQMTRFGIKTTVRGITYSQHSIDVYNQRFQIAIMGWGAANPHPHFSYVADLFAYNYVQAPGPGMNFPMVQETSLGKVDLEELTIECAKGLDEAKQKAMVTKIAKVFNELLPIVPLWERYGNNPALDKVRVTGWPGDEDPIYRNSAYADSFVVLMIRDGRLKPAQ